MPITPEQWQEAKNKYERNKQRKEKFTFYIACANLVIFIVSLILWTIVAIQHFK